MPVQFAVSELHHQCFPYRKLIFAKKLDMIHNVGNIDRIIRLSLALILVVLYYLNIADGEWNTYFLIGTVMLFITSMRKCCPIYALLGFGTCGIPSDGKEAIIKTKNAKLK